MNSFRSLSLILALSLPISLGGCANIKAWLAGNQAGQASLVDEALEISLPDMPEDCKKRVRAMVKEGMRLDEALLRYDNALREANDRVTRCSEWYNELKVGFND